MTSAVWKYESDAIFATNRFPARGVARRLNEGSGSWIVAYATEQHSKLKASVRKERPVHLENEDGLSFSAAEIEGSADNTPPASILDAKLMMWHHQVSSAADLCSLNIPGKGLDEVREEDFALFKNVAYVNAAENILPFRPFNSFPNIRELELPLNGLRNLSLQAGDFPNLQVLDLSYNNLSSEDVLGLGVLPKLKALTLTGNGLASIHPEMARPILVPNGNGGADVVARFRSLEVLLLDDNRLSDLSTFASLAALTELRELNLDKNGIEVVPHLKVIGNKVISETHSLGKPASTQPSRESKLSSATLKHETPQVDLQDPSPTTENVNSADQFATPDLLPDGSQQNPPFQNLKLLSLAQNQIAEEEYIVAVAAWPALTHLVLFGNPIVKNTNGQPPLISHYLNKRLGINVHRFKPRKPAHTPTAVIPNVKSRKVTSVVPKIPKQSVDTIIESFKEHLKAPPQRPPIETLPEETETTSENESQPTAPSQAPVEADEPIFLTQVDDPAEEELKLPDIKPESSRRKEKKKVRQKSVKKTAKEIRFKGYEDLLDAKDDPTLHEPVGIQGNIRALNHLLSHPTMYRSSEVTLDKILPSYEAKSSKHTAALQVARNRHVKTKPSNTEKFLLALEKLQTQKDNVIELPLTQALNQNSSDIPYSEADDLLRDVEEKYRVVRLKSLEASKSATRTFHAVKSQVNTNI